MLNAARAGSFGSATSSLFTAPFMAGREITAWFSSIQPIGKSAQIDVQFPDPVRQELENRITSGYALTPTDFPAEWAAVRQGEFFQESGNHKIYDMDATYLTRSLQELSGNMRAGGYRITVAALGSYNQNGEVDDLALLDRRLQRRIQHLIHMIYLEEQSHAANEENDRDLQQGTWNFHKALPHVGATLGARDLFRPIKAGAKLSPAERKHKQAKLFFEILDQLPSNHILHDTAFGLQLPELIGRNQMIYLTDQSLQVFNVLLNDLFTPFDRFSLAGLQGRPDAKPEIKATAQHMRAYGDRLTPESDAFYRGLAHYSLR